MSPVPGDNRQDPHNPTGEDLGMAAMDTNIIIAGSSGSDSAGEDDNPNYHGYEALPQEPPTDMESQEDTDDAMETDGAVGGSYGETILDSTVKQILDTDNLNSRNIPSNLQLAADSRSEEVEERKSLWSEIRVQPQQPMEQDHIDKIKSAMGGFALPSCQIPSWAKVMSEQDWKKQLVSRLHGQHGQVPLISSQEVSQDSSSPSEEQAPLPATEPSNEYGTQSNPANEHTGYSGGVESDPASKQVSYVGQVEQDGEEGNTNETKVTTSTENEEKVQNNQEKR